jgi:AAA15 family ATPase/GTPase
MRLVTHSYTHPILVWLNPILCRNSAQNAVSLYDSCMLLRFRCKNFRSIREEQELSLIAAKTRTDEKSESLIDTPFEDLKLLRCVAIYGANASGKSNVLAALSAFSQIVSQSQRLWKPYGPIPAYAPFLLDEMSRTEHTEFEIGFLIDSSTYKYGFRFDQTAFHEEWLIDTTGRDKVLFRRMTEDPQGVKRRGVEDLRAFAALPAREKIADSKGRSVEFLAAIDALTTVSFPNRNLGKTLEESRHLDGIRLDVRPNSLFLSAAAQKNHPVLSRICAYLSDALEAIRGQDIPSLMTRTAATCSEGDRREQIAKMMEFADTGIQDLEVTTQHVPYKDKHAISNLGEYASLLALKWAPPESFLEIPTDGSNLPQSFEIRMTHQGDGGKSFPLESSQESDGTVAYFSILGPLLDALRDGKVLMIDELESSLHPALARELVRVFNSPDLNPKGAQIIFTTHNTNLLDLNLLRRDQIWFTEKSRDGATRLYPLSDYQPRTNQNIEAGYLGGRFGAIPFLDEQLLRDSLLPIEPAQASLEFSSEA